MKNFKNKRGITLIALVVTIIILIILAAVSINLILGQNGILTKAREGRENYELAAEDEQKGLNSLFDDINDKTNSDNNEELGDWVAAWVQTASGWDDTAYYPGDKTDEELEAMGTIVARLYENGGKVTTGDWEYDEEEDDDVWVEETLDSYTLVMTGSGELAPVEYHDTEGDWYYGWAVNYRRAYQITNAIISSGITNIPSSYFKSTSLTNLTISDTVERIDESLDDTIWYSNQPDGDIYIGKIYYKFKGDMPNNTTITIKEGTKSIEHGAFYSKSELSNIIIPNSVTRIGEHAFDGCTALTNITIPNSVISIGGGAFAGCTLLSDVTLPNSLNSIEADTFEWCTSLTNITIPNSVVTIESWAFRDCSALTSVTIPNSVVTIKSWAFEECSALTSVTIPNSVVTIESWAFKGCSALTSVTIGSGVTFIGCCNFYESNNLSSITFIDTEGWYVTGNEDDTSGISVDVTNTSRNVILFKNSIADEVPGYDGYYWKKSQ